MEDNSKAAEAGGVDGSGEIGWPSQPGMLPPKGGVVLPMPWKREMTAYLLSQLVGRKLRVSDGLVLGDIDWGRVTILVDKENRIQDLWVDPDREKK